MISGWFPTNKDKISCGISIVDWNYPGDNRYLDCGSFTVDDVSANGHPIKLSISAVSAPVSTGFNSEDKTVTWESVTIRQIAERIATDTGLYFVYDAPLDIFIAATEQNGTDCSFLNSLCDKYGLSMKIYNDKLVIYDREDYKSRAAIATINLEEMKSWNYNETLQGTYTGVKYSYSDSSNNADIEYTYGSTERMLSVNLQAADLVDAELQAIASLNKANHSAVTMSVTVIGNPSLVAGSNVYISGIGRPDGKYFIDEITHSIGGGYTTSLTLSKVQ